MNFLKALNMDHWPSRAVIGLNYEEQKSYAGILWFFVFYIGSLILGALLAPIIYGVILQWHAAAPTFLTQYLIKKPFVLYIDRIRLMGAIFGLIYLIFHYRVFHLWPKTGWKLKDRLAYRRLMLWAFAFIMILGGVQYACKVVELEANVTLWIFVLKSVKILISAIVVAFLEETLFRGFIFRAFYSAFSPIWALNLSSFLFAWLHFKGPKVYFAVNEISWWNSFKAAGFLSVGPIYNLNVITFLNLFLIGYICNILFLQHRHLWAAWVFHLSLIWGSFTYKAIVDTCNTHLAWLLGTAKCTDGLLSCFLLLSFLIFLIKKQNFLWEAKFNQNGPMV